MLDTPIESSVNLVNGCGISAGDGISAVVALMKSPSLRRFGQLRKNGRTARKVRLDRTFTSKTGSALRLTDSREDHLLVNSSRSSIVRKRGAGYISSKLVSLGQSERGCRVFKVKGSIWDAGRFH
jgi:hypothetical protein